MTDALDQAILINGFLAKRPIRELAEIGVECPSKFEDGFAFRIITNHGPRFVLIFIECEPDAFYLVEFNHDTRLQLGDQQP